MYYAEGTSRPASSEIPRHGVSNVVQEKTSHTSHQFRLEELSTSCVTPLGEDSWKLAHGFLQTLPHEPFPFADFALYHFAKINLSCSVVRNLMFPKERSSLCPRLLGGNLWHFGMSCLIKVSIYCREHGPHQTVKQCDLWWGSVSQYQCDLQRD